MRKMLDAYQRAPVSRGLSYFRASRPSTIRICSEP
jgi:hypothetical protein